MRQIFLMLFLFFNLSVNAQKGQATRYNPRFDYEPPKREEIGSANVTVALLKPVFIDKEVQRAGPPWSDFSVMMQNDIEELLNAKGIKVRGPFSSRDEMVFTDKDASDFTFEISIDLRVDANRTEKVVLFTFGGPDRKVEKGDVTISSSVVITAISNFSGEKLWKKNLQIPQKNYSYAGYTKWVAIPALIDELKGDNNAYNPFAKKLEEIYVEGLTILWNQFDVNEVRNIAEVAKREKVRKN